MCGRIQRTFSGTTVPRTVVTEESSFISKETNPGCGTGHKKDLELSSLPATHRLRIIHTHTEQKREKGGGEKKKKEIYVLREITT